MISKINLGKSLVSQIQNPFHALPDHTEYDPIYDQIYGTLDNNLYDQTNEQLDNKLYEKILSQIFEPLYEKIYRQLFEELKDELENTSR